MLGLAWRTVGRARQAWLEDTGNRADFPRGNPLKPNDFR